jgi:hypothetical protein
MLGNIEHSEIILAELCAAAIKLRNYSVADR